MLLGEATLITESEIHLFPYFWISGCADMFLDVFSGFFVCSLQHVGPESEKACGAIGSHMDPVQEIRLQRFAEQSNLIPQAMVALSCSRTSGQDHGSHSLRVKGYIVAR